MNNKVKPATRALEDSFVYSCTFSQQRGHEQFVPYQVLPFQFSGDTHIQHQNSRLVLKKNQIILAQKNQLTKFLKIPGPDKVKTFLFDFSEPYKLDLQKFILRNYHYNVPIEQFAKLTGRSLAAFKRDFASIFQTSPRKWLQEKRLSEAYHLIKQKKIKSSEMYLELGFENISHFYKSFKQKYGVTPGSIQ